ncbi:MAG: hypothetical protein QXP55_05120 [Nitrososphaerales archaeon]
MSTMNVLEKRTKSLVFTIEECDSCHLKMKRDFRLGDYIYKEGGECSKCKGKTKIIMIYSEKVE